MCSTDSVTSKKVFNTQHVIAARTRYIPYRRGTPGSINGVGSIPVRAHQTVAGPWVRSATKYTKQYT